MGGNTWKKIGFTTAHLSQAVDLDLSSKLKLHVRRLGDADVARGLNKCISVHVNEICELYTRHTVYYMSGSLLCGSSWCFFHLFLFPVQRFFVWFFLTSIGGSEGDIHSTDRGNAIVILGNKNKNDLPSIYSRLLHTGQWFLCAFLITCVAVVLKNLMTSYRIASMTCRKDFCCCSLMSKHVKSTQSLTAAALLFIHHQCVFVSFTCGRQGRYNRLRSDRCRLWVAHGALHSWLTWALRGNGFCALPVPPPPGHVGSVCFCKP